MRPPVMAATKLRALAKYSACDVSDALLKLKVPRAGFLADINPFAPHAPFSDALKHQAKVIAPASTVLLVPKNASSESPAFQNVQESNIPSGAHYIDLTKPDTVVVLSQPTGQWCASLGGIMALRMKVRGAKGVVVGGRVRDLTELRSLEFPIWARASSTVGSGAEAKPWAIDVPVEIEGVTINPGDIIFGDPLEGVVAIPRDKLDAVLELIPRIVEADDMATEDVRNGRAVKDAFAEHRKGL